MKRNGLFVLVFALAAVLCTGCGVKDEDLKSDPLVNADGTAPVGSTLVAPAPQDDFVLLDNKDILSANGLYYASWVSGDAQPYENSDGKTVDLYDAQLTLVVQENKTEDKAASAVTGWKDLAQQNYQISDTQTLTAAGQEYTVIVFAYQSDSNPYATGVTAFAQRGTSAIEWELSCQDSYSGYALLSSSLLVLLPVCILGGLLVGPAISGMMDALFRSYRDAPRGWWENYCKGMKQNWKSSLLPGIVFCLALGIELFFGMVLFSAEQLPGIGTLAIFFVGLLLLMMLFTAFWPQVVLFEESNLHRLQNAILFCLKYGKHVIGTAALQLGWWILFVLFLPWTGFLVPFLGVWFIWFVCFFLLYSDFDAAYGIEEKIHQQFPEQTPRYDE